MGDGKVLRGPGTRPVDVLRASTDCSGRERAVLGRPCFWEVNLLLWPAEHDHRNAAPAEPERNGTEQIGSERKLHLP